MAVLSGTGFLAVWVTPVHGVVVRVGTDTREVEDDVHTHVTQVLGRADP
nr:hypothetical protein [Streptomyces phaeolivaceus]